MARTRQACGNMEWTFAASRGEVRLVGGFCCPLTCEEENEWHDFIVGNEVYCQWQKGRDRLQVLMSAHYELPDKASVNVILVEYANWRILENQLYVIGRDWYAGLLERREKARQAENEKDDRNG